MAILAAETAYPEKKPESRKAGGGKNLGWIEK
jgi:hypothetical protein